MLHGIKIGGLVIENPVALAPMAGVGDSPFRNLVAGYGEPEFRPSFLVSEMVSSKAQTILLDMKKPRNARVERMMRAVSAAGSRPQKGFPLTSVQIFGSDPAVMARSARLNEELGAAMIDINMGCPVGKIIKSGSGSDLLKDPALAERIVEAVARAVKIPVGVKMRTGWDDKGRDAAGFARMLESSGASMIAVHGRTRSQFYSGPVDFDSIAAVKRAVKVPVIGNGDITSPQLAREMMEKTGCDGVMIGRGACGAPWILSHVVRYLKTGVLAP
ncbi:MAG: tRNA dihydrouridine synthase DusB, partial [Rickettsiales bacterium]|nr:tRNA dihydrouridine synthase DusB [Rickettsiales bacterium]